MQSHELITFVQKNGYPSFSARQLKRLREEKLVEVQIEHSGFGETRSLYSPETAQCVLTICRLLQGKRDFHMVRFRLWLEGERVEIGALKYSIWKLTPFATWKEPTTKRERQTMAKKLAQDILHEAWKSVRMNFGRTVLQNFRTTEDQRWFVSLEAQLLWGVDVDFRRDFLNDGEVNDVFEENADILTHGLQTKHFRSLPKDVAEGLQDISEKHLLSWTKQKAVLFAATIEELELARERQEILAQMLECLEMMAPANVLHRLVRKLLKRPTAQVLLFIAALMMEQGGYSYQLEQIAAAIRANWFIIQRMQAFRLVLQQELPPIAKEIPPLHVLAKMFSEGTRQEQEAYLEHVQEVYQQNKEAFDAFWQRHPELNIE